MEKLVNQEIEAEGPSYYYFLNFKQILNLFQMFHLNSFSEVLFRSPYDSYSAL